MKRATVCDTNRSFYKHWTAINLRYGDTDRQGHINNAVYCTLLESGRVDFLFDGGKFIAGEGKACVIARLSLDYLKEMHFPGLAEIGSKVIRIGGSSFTVGQAIFWNGHCCSTAESVIVSVEEQSGRPAAIGGVLLRRLQELS